MYWIYVLDIDVSCPMKLTILHYQDGLYGQFSNIQQSAKSLPCRTASL